MEMQGLQDIADFIKSDHRDYDLGLRLLQDSGYKNARLLVLMSRGPSTYNRDKLVTELKAVLKKHRNGLVQLQKRSTGRGPEKSQKISKVSSGQEPKYEPGGSYFNQSVQKVRPNRANSISGERSGASSEHLTPDLVVILDRVTTDLTKLYKKRGFQHHEMRNCISDSERYRLAKSIMELQRDIETHLGWRDHIKEHSEVPSDLKAHYRTGEEEKRVSNLKNYVRRYRNLVKKATSEQEKARFQKKLEEHEQNLKKLT
jgi:hypothetical protein